MCKRTVARLYYAAQNTNKHFEKLNVPRLRYQGTKIKKKKMSPTVDKWPRWAPLCGITRIGWYAVNQTVYLTPVHSRLMTVSRIILISTVNLWGTTVCVFVVLRSFLKLEWLLGHHNRSTIRLLKTSLTIKVCGSEHCSNIKGKNEERLWNNTRVFRSETPLLYIKTQVK